MKQKNKIFTNFKSILQNPLFSKFLFIVFFSIFTIFLLYIYIISGNNIIVSKLIYYIFVLILFLLSVLGYKAFKLDSIYLFIISFGLIAIFAIPYFSPIDEGAHFEYIHAINQEKTLPLINTTMDTDYLHSLTDKNVPGEGTIRYEAFQPPLYYLIATAIMSLPPDSVQVDFFSLRFLGLISMVVTYVFLKKTYLLLTHANVLKRRDKLFYSLSFLLTISPSFVTRMITLSNEHLAVLLCSILSYLTFKIFINRKFNINMTTLLSILTGAALLTKITTFFIPLIITFVFIINKQNKHALFYVFLLAMIFSPWIGYNLYHYNSLTASYEHINFVLQIVNPANTSKGLIYALDAIPQFLNSIFLPQEYLSPDYPLVQYITSFLSIIILFSILICMYLITKLILKRKSIVKLYFLFLFPILSNIAFLVISTKLTKVDVLIGRYLYINLIQLVLVIYITLEWLFKKVHKKTILPYIISFFACFLIVAYAVFILKNLS